MTEDRIMQIWYSVFGTPTEHEPEPRYVHESVEHIVEFAHDLITADRAQRKPLTDEQITKDFDAQYPDFAASMRRPDLLRYPDDWINVGHYMRGIDAFRSGVRYAERLQGQPTGANDG